MLLVSPQSRCTCSVIFFYGADTQVLFGDNFDISKVNDDSLGRMLDALYEYGVEKFFLEFGN
jgi:hypothetical protein